MLQIRPDADGFVIFDTIDEQAVIRCDTFSEASDLVAELTVADAHALLQVWCLPA